MTIRPAFLSSASILLTFLHSHAVIFPYSLLTPFLLHISPGILRDHHSPLKALDGVEAVPTARHTPGLNEAGMCDQRID